MCIRDRGTNIHLGAQNMHWEEKGAFTGETSPLMLNELEVELSLIHIFYGIEINDFAVTVAKTALWIAESQMLKETEDIVHTTIDFLPLKRYANIAEGNACLLYTSVSTGISSFTPFFSAFSISSLAKETFSSSSRESPMP